MEVKKLVGVVNDLSIDHEVTSQDIVGLQQDVGAMKTSVQVL